MSYSYNNIIVKSEPLGKHELDTLIRADLDVADLSPPPTITTAWRQFGLDGAEAAPPSLHSVKDTDVIVIDHFLTREECRSIVETCESLGFTFWADPSAASHMPPSPQPDGTNALPVGSPPHPQPPELPLGTGTHDGAPRQEQEEAGAAPRHHTDAFRSAFTVEVHLEEFARRLWARLQPIALAHIGTKIFSPTMMNADTAFERDLEGAWEPVGVCDNILFARYHAGGHFAPHVDGCNVLDINTRTLYTVLVYLNDCALGGETFILSGEQCDALEQDLETGRFHGKACTRVGAVVPKEGRASIFYYNVLHEGAPVAPGGEHVKYIIRADVLYKRNPPILTEKNDVDAFRIYQEARVLEADGHALAAVKKFQAVRKLSHGVADLYQL